MKYYVYILTNKNCNVLYTGVTSNLVRRVYEHKNHEETTDVRAALEREKQIKSWNRERKTSLIMAMNPRWLDLYPRILG